MSGNQFTLVKAGPVEKHPHNAETTFIYFVEKFS